MRVCGTDGGERGGDHKRGCDGWSVCRDQLTQKQHGQRGGGHTVCAPQYQTGCGLKEASTENVAFCPTQQGTTETQ